MKRLFLVRHAKSDWSTSGMADFSRPLNDRGHRVAPKMGTLLFEKGVSPELLVSSPAVRAATTAKYFADEIGYPSDNIKLEDAIYGASSVSLLKVVNELPDSAKSVMLFGHNPGFSYFAEELSNGRLGNFPTCAVVCIDFEVDLWSEISLGMGINKWYSYPSQFDF